MGLWIAFSLPPPYPRKTFFLFPFTSMFPRYLTEESTIFLFSFRYCGRMCADTCRPPLWTSPSKIGSPTRAREGRSLPTFSLQRIRRKSFPSSGKKFPSPLPSLPIGGSTPFSYSQLFVELLQHFTSGMPPYMSPGERPYLFLG